MSHLIQTWLNNCAKLLAILLIVIVNVCESAAGDQTADSSKNVTCERVGCIAHPRFREPSGLIASRQNPGLSWSVCDSGNSPWLFGFDEKCQILASIPIQLAVNIDLETITINQDDELIIGDVGNNLGLLPVRWFVVVKEPDPKAKEPLAIKRIMTMTFPSQPFDVEASFMDQRALYVISKDAEQATLFRVPEKKLKERSTAIREISVLPQFTKVTGADWNQEKLLLAVCRPDAVAIYQFGQDPNKKFAAPRQIKKSSLPNSRIESCCWSGGDLWLLSETCEFFRIRGKQLK